MKKIFLSVLTLFLLGNVMAQKEANVWVFGEGIEVDFSTGKPIASKGGFTSGIAGTEGEGFASFSDAQGILLFFTEGENVFNADGTVMTNGTDLNGDLSSMQSATILPKVGTTNEYYIFTVGEAISKKGIQYSVVKYDNVKKQGEVITKNIPLITNQYMMEALTIVPHSNGIDSWVIVHGAGGSNKYYTYQVSALGISEAVISSTGLTVPLTTVAGSPDANQIGLIKSNSCYTQIAMANLSLKKAEVLAFDNATGKVGDVYATIDGFIGYLYGIEFSPNGKYIYTSEYDFKKLAQFEITTGGNVTNTRVDLGVGIDNRLGQLQQGPDGKIYMAGHSWSGKTHLGVINSPNEKGTSSNVNFNLIEFDYGVEGQICTMGLPQFAKQYVSNIVTLAIDGKKLNDIEVCQGTTLKLGTQSLQPIVSYKWEIDTPITNTYNTIDPSHTFNKVGNIPIKLISVNQVCGHQKVINETIYVHEITKSTAEHKNPTASHCENQDIVLVGKSMNKDVQNYRWWNSVTEGTELALGVEYTYNGTLPKKIWIEPLGTLYGSVGGTGNTAEAVANAFTKFTLTQNVILVSVGVVAYTWGPTCEGSSITYEIRKDDATIGTVVNSGTINFDDCNNVVDIPLNLEMEKGIYYIIYKSKTGPANIGQGGSFTGPYTGANGIITVDKGTGSPFVPKNGPFNEFVIQELIPCAERTEFEIQKNCTITSLSSQKEETSIYPNPFTNTITINNISSSIDKIQLVDVYGNVVEEISNPSKNVEMGNTISSGTYFIYLHSSENVEIQKVVKIN